MLINCTKNVCIDFAAPGISLRVSKLLAQFAQPEFGCEGYGALRDSVNKALGAMTTQLQTRLNCVERKEAAGACPAGSRYFLVKFQKLLNLGWVRHRWKREENSSLLFAKPLRKAAISSPQAQIACAWLQPAHPDSAALRSHDNLFGSDAQAKSPPPTGLITAAMRIIITRIESG